MDFYSTHTRLTRTSSDLRVLSGVLVPPSPILNPDDLLISSTSGEIPILLEAVTYACDSPLPTFTRRLPKLCDVVEELEVTHDTTGHIVLDLTRGCDAQNWMCEKSNATDSVVRLANGRHAGSLSSNAPPGSAISGKLEDGATHPSLHCDALGAGDQRSGVLCDYSSSVFGRQGEFEESRDLQFSYPNTMDLSAAAVVPKEDLDGDLQRMMTTFHTYSTLPTPTFAPPSPSPSVDVILPLPLPVSQQCHRKPLERARAVRLPGRPRSPRSHVNKTETNIIRNGSPSPNGQASYTQCALTDSAPMVPVSSCVVDTPGSGTAHPDPKQVGLPEELSWLKPISIELWIDQEGFRAVRPCMQLVGYSPRTRSFHPYKSAVSRAWIDVTAGVAEFMPTKREAFVFHYTVLDSAPTLRMVSIAGDESRDYTSRQATLSVKTNGVYTVLGTETLMTPTINNDAHGLRLQNTRLRWKFDYLVSDRKVDGTKKTLPGEKTLTPLTFSCSPYLFHPFQGKKAGLMHIMKKSLVPRLGSQKLEPPTCTPGHGNSISQAAPHQLSVGVDVGIHIRSHSDTFTKGGRYPPAGLPLDPGFRGSTQISHSRRRRASSAGENSLTCPKDDSGPEHDGIAMSKDLALFV